MNKFETLESVMCKELEALEHKLQGGAEMSTADLDKIDKLAHAMKSLATYKAMKDPEAWEDGEMSGRRGMNGRYVSRGYGPDGYSGYMHPHGPYPEYRW